MDRHLAVRARRGRVPRLSGGTRGLTVPPDWSPTTHYELALALVVLAALGHRALSSSTFGLALRAAAQRPAAAAALGTEAGRLRLRAFAGAAAVGGLAGALDVQLAGVADASAYGARLSFVLLVAVLVGGAATALGPVVGVLLLGALSLAAETVGGLSGGEATRFAPLLAALLLLAVLTSGADGIVPALTSWLRPRVRPGDASGAAARASRAPRSRRAAPRSDSAASTPSTGSTSSSSRAASSRSSARTARGRRRRSACSPGPSARTRAASCSTGST